VSVLRDAQEAWVSLGFETVVDALLVPGAPCVALCGVIAEHNTCA
jgi:hypothetical protein